MTGDELGAAAVQASLVLCALLAGCASDDAGSAPPSLDGGAEDAGVMGQDGGEPDMADEGVLAGPGSGRASETDTGDLPGDLSCFDGVDNDGADGADCDDPDCAVLASCCVGRGDCCVTAPGAAPGALDLSACAGMDPATCLGGTAFGTPPSHIGDGGALLPGGDAEFDSGVVLSGPLDLTTHRVALEVGFGRASACGTSCLEAAGVSLTTQTTFDDATHVRPLVGLVYGGSDDAVALVVHDAVVARWPVQADGERWTLTVRPTGRLSVHRSGQELPLPDAAAFVPTPGARWVVHGRNRITDAAAAARLTFLSAQAWLCDMPGAWKSREPLRLVDGSGEEVKLPDLDGLSAVALADGTLLLALAADGEIRFASSEDGVTFTLGTLAPLAPQWGHDARGITDPSLVRGPLAELELYYTAHGADGASRIGRATWNGSDAGFASASEPVAGPEDLPDVRWLASPAARWHASGALVMAARAGTDGGERLAILTWSPVTGLARLDGRPLNDAADALLAGVDARAGLALTVHADAWRLYVASTDGTRGSIAALVSDDLVRWRAVGEVLAGSGDGFARLGVSAPSVVPAGDGLALYHLGHDGVRVTPGRAVRPLPAEAP